MMINLIILTCLNQIIKLKKKEIDTSHRKIYQFCLLFLPFNMKIVVSFIIILFGIVISLRTSFQKAKLKLLRPITIAMKATGKDTNPDTVNTGYNYAHRGLDYDVPFINNFKW